MKQIKLIWFLLALNCGSVVTMGSVPALDFFPGEGLTVINKLMDTPDFYSRVDTLKYDGFTDFQRRDLVQHPAGMALVFETNSDCVYSRIHYQKKYHQVTSPDMSVSGLSLYIKDKNGNWKYAGSNAPEGDPVEVFPLVKNMANGKKECILYLPVFAILDSLEIGVTPGCYVKPIENPFRHRVVFHGSSFTHGASVSHPAMSYVLQFERATGLHTPVLGVGGNSQLQQSWAKVLADTPADAIVLDAFSNPTAEQVEERFDSFLATIRSNHPNIPIIFMQTIYRGNRNFDTYRDGKEKARMEVAERKVREAMKRDKNVYLIFPDAGEDTTCDGTHPSDLGYWLWMQSIKRPILKILSKYGIK